MGLISKEIEIAVSNSNYRHFEKLGYEIPMKLASESTYRRYKHKYVVDNGKKIKVKVEDLPKGSHTKVKVKCDYCGIEYEIDYKTYLNHNHNGKTYCNKCHNKVFLSGDKSPNYNPIKTEEERINQRRYFGYTEFIKKVMKRDDYTCQCCNKKLNHDGVVHHLYSYDNFKEKRTDEANGITLCETCHKNFHSIYGYGNNTKEQFEEWIGYTIGELERYEGRLTPTKRIYCIEENKIYESAKEIHLLWKCDYSYIYDVCNHKIKKQGKYSAECRTVKGKHLLWLTEAIEKGCVKA